MIDQLEVENQQLRSTIEHLNTKQQVGNNHHSGDDTKKPKFKVASAKPAPRLYCDICDVFDSHDTEDCPQQSMQPADEHDDVATHSRYNLRSSASATSATTAAVTVSSSAANRAYCDLCESFGHEEVDCPSKSQEKNQSEEEF